jgi:predicted transcriptional regulator
VIIAVKEQAHQLIDKLPESATWSDVLYALELRTDVDEGLADANAGRVTSVEEIRREYGSKR